MKNFFRKILPENLKDYYFWFLTVVVMMPFIYITIGVKRVNYMPLNFVWLCLALFFTGYLTILKLIQKKKIRTPNLIRDRIIFEILKENSILKGVALTGPAVSVFSGIAAL